MEAEKIANVFYEDGHVFYLRVDDKNHFCNNPDHVVEQALMPVLKNLKENKYNVSYPHAAIEDNIRARHNGVQCGEILRGIMLSGRLIMKLRLVRNYEKENEHYLIPIGYECLQF